MLRHINNKYIKAVIENIRDEEKETFNGFRMKQPKCRKIINIIEQRD